MCRRRTGWPLSPPISDCFFVSCVGKIRRFLPSRNVPLLVGGEALSCVLMMIEPRNFQLREILACPCDHKILQSVGGNLICPNGHRFMIENGIPVFLEHPRRELIPSNMGRCKRENEHSEIDPFVDDWLVNTNGNLYWKARGRLKRYPIPAWPSVTGENKVLLDIGC